MMVIRQLFSSVVFLMILRSVNNMTYEKLEEFRKSPRFVDKTLLIKEFLNFNSNKTLILAAPDGFGKTSNLHIMKGFLMKDSNMTQVENIFLGTKISEDEDFVRKEMGNHSILYCSFKLDKPIVDHKSLIRGFRAILHRTFALHPYLARSTKISGYDKKRLTCYTGVKKHLKMRPFQILVGLHFLTKVLKAHHDRKVVLMIDDFDSVILDSIFNNELEYETALGFHNALLRVTLENNVHLSKTLLVGVSCTCMKPLQQLLPLRCIGFLENNNYASFFGLTELDLEQLLNKEEFMNLRLRKKDITKWYGGYVSPDYKVQVYNTRSVINFLKSGEFRNYWVGTRAVKILKYLLIEPVVQQLFNDSINQRSIKIKQHTSLNKIETEQIKGIKSFSVNELWDENFADLFVRLLIEKGYFTFSNDAKKKSKDKKLIVKVPNKEMSTVFNQIQTTFLQDSTELLDRLKEAVHQASFPVTDKEEIERIVAEETGTEKYLGELSVTNRGKLDSLLNKLT